MKQSWLIVTNISKMPKGARWEFTMTTFTTGKKAEAVALKYQNELNGGLDMEGCIKAKQDFYSVVAIPWSQARDYSPDAIKKAIEEAKEYK